MSHISVIQRPGQVLSGPQVTLRKPRPADVLQRLALMDQVEANPLLGVCHVPSQAIRLAHAQRELDQIEAHPWAWVIDHDRKYIGDISFTAQKEQDDEFAEMQIFIRDRQKIGRKLGSASIVLGISEMLTTTNVDKIELSVWTDNLPAVYSYQKCGFKPKNPEIDLATVKGAKPFYMWMALDVPDFWQRLGRPGNTPLAQP